MFNEIILGTIQGISEWLPVSSEGLIVLASVNLLGIKMTANEMIRLALFLHLGTFFSALIYFRKDVLILLKSLINYKSADNNEKKVLNFLIISTLTTGTIGLIILKFISDLDRFKVSGQAITIGIGILLLITAGLMIKQKKGGIKEKENLTTKDSIILGIMQGFSALPGFSRSGFTIAGLLLRKFDKTLSLKLSFLMSLPVVLGGNILLNIKGFAFNIDYLAGLIASFIFGLLTIHLFLKIAQKINFGYFVFGFGLLMIVFGFI